MDEEKVYLNKKGLNIFRFLPLGWNPAIIQIFFEQNENEGDVTSEFFEFLERVKNDEEQQEMYKQRKEQESGGIEEFSEVIDDLHSEEKKKLGRLKAGIERKESMIRRLRDQIFNLKCDLLRKKPGFLNGYGNGILKELGKEGKLFIEECGENEGITVDLYAVKGDITRYIGRKPEERAKPPYGEMNQGKSESKRRKRGPPRLGYINFIEEELDPVEVHKHDGSLEHRTWEAQGRDLEALFTLMDERKVSQAYLENGWKGAWMRDKKRTSDRPSYPHPSEEDESFEGEKERVVPAREKALREELGQKIWDLRRLKKRLQRLAQRLKESSRKDLDAEGGYDDPRRDILRYLSNGWSLIMEDCGENMRLEADVYAVKGGRERYLGKKKENSTKISRSVFLNFVKKELEPRERHEHRAYLNHNIWVVEGRDIDALQFLMEDDEIGEIYLEEGWRGVNDLMEELRERCKEGYPIFEGRVRASMMDRNKRKKKYRLRERISKFADEEDISPKEAVVALKLKDEDFAKAHDKIMRRVEERLRKMEDSLGPYTKDVHPFFVFKKTKVEKRSDIDG